MLKNEKGITLIALIITIIVMLILVGVTINVALNGGLFDKATQAKEQTTREAEIEALSMAAIAAWDVEDGVDFGEMQLPEGFEGVEGSDGTYTSRKSGKTYKVDKTTAKVTEGETQEIDDDLAYLKAELEGKMMSDVISGVDANYIPIFKNTEITVVNVIENFEGDTLASLLMYKGKYYQATCDDFTLENPTIIKIERSIYTEDYFRIGIEGSNVKILELTPKGEKDVEANKKLVIPATISNYNVTEIGEYAFYQNTNIEELELPNSVTTIGYYAFAYCTSINEFTLPYSVENLAQQVFVNWKANQTIYMQGRKEEPVTTDNYSGIGWENGWRVSCNANIVWDN